MGEETLEEAPEDEAWMISPKSADNREATPGRPKWCMHPMGPHSTKSLKKSTRIGSSAPGRSLIALMTFGSRIPQGDCWGCAVVEAVGWDILNVDDGDDCCGLRLSMSADAEPISSPVL